MKNNFIYISCLSVLALFSACTGKDDNSGMESSAPAPLSIYAGSRDASTSEWHDFNENAEITVYNAGSNLNATKADQKGIYKNTKQTNGALKWINQPTNDANGLWSDAIQGDNDNGAYFFTATSGTYGQVRLNQTKGYTEDDFLVARSKVALATPGNTDQEKMNYWEKEGITLHFRHVLSKLQVNVFLPKAEDVTAPEDDGYFVYNNITDVSMGLVKPRDKYTVTYDTSLEDKGIATVTTVETKASTNLQMCSAGSEETTIPGDNTIYAKKYSFEAIIPDRQYYPETQECLNITVNYKGKGELKFTYTPPSNDIIRFEQEKRTIVNLILQHKKPDNKVYLYSVKLKDWITDKADMDLIPVK